MDTPALDDLQEITFINSLFARLGFMAYQPLSILYA